MVACSSVGGAGDEAGIKCRCACIGARGILAVTFIACSSVGGTKLASACAVERLVVDEAGGDAS